MHRRLSMWTDCTGARLFLQGHAFGGKLRSAWVEPRVALLFKDSCVFVSGKCNCAIFRCSHCPQRGKLDVGVSAQSILRV